MPGPVVNDPTKATENTVWLQQQADSGFIRLPIGVLFINQAIKLPISIGVLIKSDGAGAGYWYPDDHPSRISNKQSRIRQLAPRTPVFIYRGAGVVSDSPVILEGKGQGPAIIVEGRAGPVATGHHRWNNWGFWNWNQCFQALAGYFKDDGGFVNDENHADNSKVNDIYAFNCDTIFRSQNQQALNWLFDGVFWQGTTKPDTVGVPFDIQRGGSLTVRQFIVENPRWSFLRLKDFSPNNCWYDFSGVWVDSMVDRNTSFTWVEYVGDPVAAAWSKFIINLEAFTSTQALPIEQHQQFKVPVNLPRADWNISIRHVLQSPTNV